MFRFVRSCLVCAAGFLFAAYSAASAAPVEKVLYSFCPHRNCADGAAPTGALITDKAGNFYGTAYWGGQILKDCDLSQCGTVFRLTPNGAVSVLHAFSGTDGGNPQSGLIADGAGNLYGTTILGGANGLGTVFKIAPDGTEIVLHSFQGGSDGSEPIAGLAMDSNGNLFGTTWRGGSTAECDGNNEGCGTVFEVKPSGDENVIYAFQGGADGGLPVAALIVDNMGNLYGTASSGGVECEGYTQGCGTVYKVANNGIETVLYDFTGGSDGVYPWSSLITDKSGNFYGTTVLGGGGSICGVGCGTIFKLTPGAIETVLYAFKGGSDGAYPEAGLIADNAGNFYGTTYSGGRTCNACGGTAFKLAMDGVETVLYAFGAKNGSGPASPLYMDKTGALFGTASTGGAHHEGVVFRIKN